MRCENKINMWILQIISQQMCFCLRVLRRTTGFFISRANAPRVLREILFLVQNTLDCYEKFFFSCKTPLIVTRNFFLVQNTLDCYGKFFFSCKTPLIVTGFFFLVQNTLECYGKFFFSCKTPLSETNVSQHG